MKKFVIAMLLALFLPVSEVMAETEKVVFVSLEDLPPKIYKENEQLTGTYVEIIREVCKRIQVEPEFRLYPWKRCELLVKVGDADAIFPPVITPERTEFLYFPDEPMTPKKNVVFAVKGHNLKITGLADLKNRSVGVNPYKYGSEFDNYEGLNKDVSVDIPMLIKKLERNRIDVAVAAEVPFRFFARKTGWADKFEVVYVISEENSYVAFSKAKGLKNRELCEKFGKALRQLKEEGVVRQIENKYY